MAKLSKLIIESMHYYEMHRKLCDAIVFEFDKKFGFVDNPVVDIFMQTDGLTILYRDENTDSNNAFVDENQDIEKFYNCENVSELLKMLQEASG